MKVTQSRNCDVVDLIIQNLYLGIPLVGSPTKQKATFIFQRNTSTAGTTTLVSIDKRHYIRIIDLYNLTG